MFANLLLVAANLHRRPGVAFPIGIGLALHCRVILNYFLAPAGNPVLLFTGVGLVAAAIVVDALAFKARGSESAEQGSRGIRLSVLCGVLMGSFFRS